ncbi:MAG: hypothetical protein UH542_05995 [Bacteroidales bacterium]|nr:hypothetical protein [Bacteroidales bacterium]
MVYFDKFDSCDSDNMPSKGLRTPPITKRCERLGRYILRRQPLESQGVGVHRILLMAR